MPIVKRVKVTVVMSLGDLSAFLAEAHDLVDLRIEPIAPRRAKSHAVGEETRRARVKDMLGDKPKRKKFDPVTKPHWTQTPKGKRKLAANTKRLWKTGKFKPKLKKAA